MFHRDPFADSKKKSGIKIFSFIFLHYFAFQTSLSTSNPDKIQVTKEAMTLLTGVNCMMNKTKMKIAKSAHDVFEAFADPEKIGNFWFSSSSERWQPGRTIILRYDEYDAEGKIDVLDMEPDRKIVFRDESQHLVTITLVEEGPSATIIEVTEEGFDESASQFIAELVDNKEGWVYALTCLKAYLEYGVNLRAALVK